MTDQEHRPEDDAPSGERPDEGPDVTELEDDPAYNPQDEELKRLKGG